MKTSIVNSRSWRADLRKLALLLLGILPGGLNAAPLYWTGQDSGGVNTTWNTSLTNWNATNATTPGNVAFSNGNDVVFSSPLVSPTTGNVAVTVSGTVSPGSMTFQKTGGSVRLFDFTGGTIAPPATVTASGGSSLPGSITFGSALQVNQDVSITGNVGFHLAGALSGTSDIHFSNTASTSSSIIGLFINTAATGSGITAAFNGSGFDGTYRIDAGRMNITSTSRIFSAGGKTLYVGDGVGLASTAVLNISATGGLTSADTIEVASDGQIFVGGHSNVGATIRFVGGGEIFRSGTAGRSLITGGIVVTSGTAKAYGTSLQLIFNQNTVFNIAAGAELQLSATNSDAIAKQSAGTFMRKTGEGKLLVEASLITANTGFKVEEGTLEFGSAAVLPSTTSIELAGGTMLAENIDLTLKNFIVSANSTLDFGSINGEVISFSGTVTLGANVINLLNFSSLDGDSLRFWNGSAATLTSDQAAQFQFGGGAYGTIDSMGYLMAVPEPSTGGLLCAGVLGLMVWRRWRGRAIAA